MNFVDAELTGGEEEMHVETDAFRLEVPRGKAPALAQHLGKDVVLGIRPEDIHDKRFVAAHVVAAPLVAKVDVTEPIGSEQYLYLVARVDPRSSAEAGQELQAAVNVENVHLFDSKTWHALWTLCHPSTRKPLARALPAAAARAYRLSRLTQLRSAHR